MLDTSKYETAVSKMSAEEIQLRIDEFRELILDDDDRVEYNILLTERRRRNPPLFSFKHGESW